MNSCPYTTRITIRRLIECYLPMTIIARGLGVLCAFDMHILPNDVHHGMYKCAQSLMLHEYVYDAKSMNVPKYCECMLIHYSKQDVQLWLLSSPFDSLQPIYF